MLYAAVLYIIKLHNTINVYYNIISSILILYIIYIYYYNLRYYEDEDEEIRNVIFC